MPTRGRQEWARLAVDVFLSQTYELKELLILDDDDMPSFPDPSIFSDSRIHYTRTASQFGGDPKTNIPMKRNALTRLAQGDFILNIDSDDWSAPERMALQVEHLERTGKAVTGFSGMYFYDVKTGRPYIYRARTNYAMGSSLCFRREWGLAHGFPEHKFIGSDYHFVKDAIKHEQLAELPHLDLMVARMHEGNTSEKRANMFQPAAVTDLPAGFLATIHACV